MVPKSYTQDKADECGKHLIKHTNEIQTVFTDVHVHQVIDVFYFVRDSRTNPKPMQLNMHTIFV